MTERRAVTYDGVEYAPGRQFRVVAEGQRLSGMTPARGGGYQGWGQALPPGTVIECLGFGPGWGSDPGYGVEWMSEESRAAQALHCEVHPSVGIPFGYRPRPGAVEAID